MLQTGYLLFLRGKHDNMTHSTAKYPARILSSVKQWFQRRFQECTHCCECSGEITPWTSHCQTCGQSNPARASISAGVFLTIAFVLLTATLAILLLSF